MAAHIAAIAGQWTYVEEQLAGLLAIAFGSADRLGDGAYSINQNWLTKAAIEEAETIRVRLKIMNATFGATLVQQQSPLLEEWKALEDKLNKRGRERNTIVHGRWMLSEQYPDDLILEERNGTYQRYTLSDLQNTLNRVIEVWQQCYQLQLAVLKAKIAGAHFPGSV